MRHILEDLKKYGGYTIYAGKSQLKAEVANSKLNWIWWVLEPFCFMLVYSFVFGVVFHAREEYHALFVFVGLSIWQFFSRCVKHSVVVIKKRRSTVAKVYIPKYFLILQEIYVDGFKMGVSMLIAAAMMIYYRVGLTWQIVMLLPIMLELALITFGISCFMLHFGVFLDDLSNIMDIVLRMLVYFVGVFYSIPRRFDAPLNSLLVKWDPVALYLDSARNILIYHKPLDYQMIFFWGVIAVVWAYAGVQLIYKNENSYIKVV